MTEFTSILDHLMLAIENVIEIFIDISNRGDIFLPSRHVFPKSMVKEILRKNKIDNDNLEPLFHIDDFDQYYKIPLTFTDYDDENKKITSLLTIPLIQEGKQLKNKFYETGRTDNFVIYKNDINEVHMPHQERDSCVNTPSLPIICLQRVCKMNILPLYRKGIKSCIMTGIEDVEISYTNIIEKIPPININCKDMPSRTIEATGQIVSFKVPSSCEANNYYFTIDAWKSSKTVKLESIELLEIIDLKNINLSDIEVNNINTFNIKSKVTEQAIFELKNIDKKLENLEFDISLNMKKADPNKMINWYLIGLISAISVLFIIITIGICVLVRIRMMKEASSLFSEMAMQ